VLRCGPSRLCRSARLTSVFVVCLLCVACAHTAEDAKAAAVTHLKKGNALRDLHLLAEAEHEYDLALASYADAANVHLSRGQVRYLQKNYRGAVEDFDFYLSKAPTDVKVLLLRSLSKSSLQHPDIAGACADLRQLKNLGVSLEQSGVGGADQYCHGQEGWDGH